tara:strand:- start:4315 stop:5757 length:1443 start_codon:yes stop_codon:yes gene_type:complete
MAKKKKENLKRFTYGHQFEPAKADLQDYIKLCECHVPDRVVLQEAIRTKFFSSHSAKTAASSTDDNQRKLAMNCFLSLRAYGLVEGNSTEYNLTDLSRKLLTLSSTPDLMLREFSKHILQNLSGTDLLKAIESLNSRGDNPTLQKIIAELNEMGYLLAANSVYPSTMRQWLNKGGLFDSKSIIAWDVYYELTGISKDFLEKAYTLTPGQKYFLLSLLELDVRDFEFWNRILEHTASVRKIDYDMKMFPSTVLIPLQSLGVIELEKSTEGRGAKPNKVKLSKKAVAEFLIPFIQNIAKLCSVEESELNKSFENVLLDVESEDIHIKGRGLELLAIWMVRLCSLRFTEWRKRDIETGKGEVDVLAASDTFVYSKWQIQCKNTSKVDVDVVAKETGMTFVTNADIIMIVTTGTFTNDARIYADRVSTVSRYYIILLDGGDIASIREDKTSVTHILDKHAKRTFARKEYGLTNIEFAEFSDDPT